jgi:hypothetical protein
LLLLLLLQLMAVSAHAAQTAAQQAFQLRCENSIGSTVAVVDAQDHGWSLDHTLTSRTLTAMKGQSGGLVLGLTRAESRIAMGSEGKLLQLAGSPYECIAPKVIVKLSYVPIIVYIGSEFAPGSCAYEEILAHEMRHLKAYLAHLPKVEAALRAALNQRFIGKPLYAAGGQARALLDQELARRWMPFARAEMAKVEAVQAAIDAPQEYARLSKVCKGEVQSLLSRRR